MKFELCCLRLIFDTMLFFPIAGKKLELATMEKSTYKNKEKLDRKKASNQLSSIF